MVNFKIYDVIDRTTNNYGTHIVLYISKSEVNQTMNFGQLLEWNMGNIFLKKS